MVFKKMEAAVDFWEQPYYKTVKTFTTLGGIWPCQSKREIITYRVGLFVIGVIQIGPQMRALWKYRNDMDKFLEAIAPFFADAGLLVKFGNICWHFKTMNYLLDQIREDWTIFSLQNGLYMLHYHSEFARKLSVIYLVGLYFAGFLYITEPLQTRIFYLFLSSNITILRRFAMPMDFGSVDLDIWYYPLLLGSGFYILALVTVFCACDLLLFMYAEHACGLFKALGYAIEHLPPYDAAEKGDYSFEYMRRCVVIHRRAIDFAGHVRDIFLWSFFGIIGLNMLSISLTAVQVVINLKAIEKLLKFAVFVFVQMMHLFVECFAAQRVMDASLELRETMTNAKWYKASYKTQKLIPLMLIRSQKPIVLTAGKMIVMNLDTFVVVLKTAVSYFMIFLAMQ